MAFAEENSSLAFDFEKDELEKLDSASASLEFHIGQRATKEIGNKGEFFDLFKSHEPITGLSRVEGLFTSAVTLSDYPARATVTQRYEITEAAEDFISRQKKSVRYRKDIFTIADRIVEFLGKKAIYPKVAISLFIDPEYTNWIEPRIKIGVRKEDLPKAYEVFNELLEYSFIGISKKTLKKLFVTIDSA